MDKPERSLADSLGDEPLSENTEATLDSQWFQMILKIDQQLANGESISMGNSGQIQVPEHVRKDLIELLNLLRSGPTSRQSNSPTRDENSGSGSIQISGTSKVDTVLLKWLVDHPELKSINAGNECESDFRLPSLVKSLVSILPDSCLDYIESLEQIGDFLLLEELGRGGMGVVFKALDTNRKRIVALKILRTVGANAGERLKREFRAIQGLAHPNLVLFDELYCVEQKWFMTMEFVDGLNFLDYFRSQSSNPIVLHSLVGQLASAVSAIHSAGIIHCDIKPQNVLITRDGRVVLLDLGLSRFDQGEKNGLYEGVIAGTKGYMSPEQRRGGSVTVSSDCYSLGVLLREALAIASANLSDCEDSAIEERNRCYRELDQLSNALTQQTPSMRPTAEAVARQLNSTSKYGKLSGRMVPGDSEQISGRSSELDQLSSIFVEVQSGRSIWLNVFGAAGIGKTKLISHFVGQVEKRGTAKVILSRSIERELFAYKASDDIIQHVGNYLKSNPQVAAQLAPEDADAVLRLFPGLERLFRVLPKRNSQLIAEQSFVAVRAFRILKRLLCQMADGLPTILWIEDVQWADVDTAQLLGEMFLATEGSPLLIIATCRDENQHDCDFLNTFQRRIHEIGKDDLCRSLFLCPLTEFESNQLVSRLILSDIDGPLIVESIVKQGHGNPFILNMLAKGAHQASSQQNIDTAALDTRLNLSSLIAEQLNSLDDGSRELLEMMAIAGGRVSSQLLTCLSGQDIDLDRSEIILRSGEFIKTIRVNDLLVFELFHDQVREAILEGLAPALRQNMHLELARKAEANGMLDADSLATHYWSGGDVERAMPHAEQAALHAEEQFAFMRAVQWYRRMITTELNDPFKLLDMKRRLARVLRYAGLYSEATSIYLEIASAAENTDEEETEECLHQAAISLMCSGDFQQGVDLLNKSLSKVGAPILTSQFRCLSSILWNSALIDLTVRLFRRPKLQASEKQQRHIDRGWQIALSLGGYEFLSALEFFTRTARLAMKWNDKRVIALTMQNLSSVAAMSGAAKARTKCLRYTRFMRTQLPTERSPGYSLNRNVMNCEKYFLSGRWRACHRASVRAESTQAVVEHRQFYLSTTYRTDPLAIFFLGELKELRTRAPLVLDEALNRGDAYASVLIRTNFCLAWLAADKVDYAQSQIDQAMASWSVRGLHLQHWLEYIARSHIDLYRGDALHGWQNMRCNFNRFDKSALLGIQHIRIMLHYLRGCSALMYCKQSSTHELLKAISSSARTIRKESIPWAQPLAMVLEAGCNDVTNKPAACDKLLKEASAHFLSCDMPLYSLAADLALASKTEGKLGELCQPLEEAIRNRGAENPVRFARMLVPLWR